MLPLLTISLRKKVETLYLAAKPVFSVSQESHGLGPRAQGGLAPAVTATGGKKKKRKKRKKEKERKKERKKKKKREKKEREEWDFKKRFSKEANGAV